LHVSEKTAQQTLEPPLHDGQVCVDRDLEGIHARVALFSNSGKRTTISQDARCPLRDFQSFFTTQHH
jgi:hypothetical protein